MAEFAQRPEDRLYDAAVSAAVASGFVIGNDADAFLHEHAQRAARDLLAGKGPGLEVAEANFRALVAAMIESRDDAYGIDAASHNRIGEETLNRALARLCPLWPFCD